MDLRCPSVPTPAEAARQGLQVAVLGEDSACHCRFQTEASDGNWGFRGGYTRARKLGGEFPLTEARVRIESLPLRAACPEYGGALKIVPFVLRTDNGR